MSIRIQFIIVLTVVGPLLSGGVAQAADYSVEIGADSQMGKDASSLICRYGSFCDGELKALGLHVAVHLRHPPFGAASVRLSGRDLSCCYFEYGRDEISIDPREPLYRLPIFKGKKARGGMVVQNERVGDFYLRFHLPKQNNSGRLQSL